MELLQNFIFLLRRQNKYIVCSGGNRFRCILLSADKQPVLIAKTINKSVIKNRMRYFSSFGFFCCSQAYLSFPFLFFSLFLPWFLASFLHAGIFCLPFRNGHAKINVKLCSFCKRLFQVQDNIFILSSRYTTSPSFSRSRACSVPEETK